jgi:colicin import membrane protein
MSERMYNPQGLGGMIGISFVLHLVFFFIFATYGSMQGLKTEPQVCYVDIADLPTANPLEGRSSPEGPSPVPAPPVPAAPAAPSAPAAKTAPSMAVPAPQKATAAPEEGKAFEEGLARVQQKQDERRQEDALAALRARLAAGGKGERGSKGSPTGSGSDYGSYIQSRLRDAFNLTMPVQSRKREALVFLNVDSAGRLTGFRIEKTSGDRLFDDSVSRAVTIAAKNFPPPPNGKEFSHKFLFRPEGVN